MNKQTEALKLALEALEETLRTLDDENAKPGGAIADTIWYSEHETLFDYLTTHITAIHEALAEESSGTEQPKLSDYEPDGMHHNKPHKCKYPKCSYPCPDLPDCRDAEQTVEEYDPDKRTISVYPSEWKAQQEPVAHCRVRPLRGDQSFPTVEVDWVSRPVPGPLYTSPPAQRKPLTDEAIIKIGNNCRLKAKPTSTGIIIHPDGMKEFARAIEAAHGIKGDA